MKSDRFRAQNVVPRCVFTDEQSRAGTNTRMTTLITDPAFKPPAPSDRPVVGWGPAGGGHAWLPGAGSQPRMAIPPKASQVTEALETLQPQGGHSSQNFRTRWIFSNIQTRNLKHLPELARPSRFQGPPLFYPAKPGESRAGQPLTLTPARTPPSSAGSDFLPLGGCLPPSPHLLERHLAASTSGDGARPGSPEESDEHAARLLPRPRQSHPFKRMPAQECASPRCFNSEDFWSKCAPVRTKLAK